MKNYLYKYSIDTLILVWWTVMNRFMKNGRYKLIQCQKYGTENYEKLNLSDISACYTFYDGILLEWSKVL